MTRKKIAYVLPSRLSNALPSTRVSVLNMLPYLNEAGYDPEIIFEPSIDNEKPDVDGLAELVYKKQFDVVYFQKVHGESVKSEIEKLSSMGVKTVFGVCDVIDNEISAAADATIAVTPYLKSLYDPGLQHKIHVVHDGIERGGLYKNQYRDHYATRQNPIEAVLVTSGNINRLPAIRSIPDYVNVTVVGNYPAISMYNRLKRKYWYLRSSAGWEDKKDYFKSIMLRKFKTVNWDIENVYEHLLSADIGIIPVDMRDDFLPDSGMSYWQVKSENRLTLKMSVGLPVIASPVPSYLNISNGENSIIASTEQQWHQSFEKLRDPHNRMAMGINARQSVVQLFSKERQARELIKILDDLLIEDRNILQAQYV